MGRLAVIGLVSAMLAACGGAREEAAAPAEAYAEPAAESDNGAADMPAPPPMTSGQGAPAPQPMNAPPAEYPNMAEPSAEPGLDRGLPVCPGDPRCKKK